MAERPKAGSIAWTDHRAGCEALRDFHMSVDGWKAEAMGGRRVCVMRDPAGAVCARFTPAG